MPLGGDKASEVDEQKEKLPPATHRSSEGLQTREQVQESIKVRDAER